MTGISFNTRKLICSRCGLHLNNCAWILCIPCISFCEYRNELWEKQPITWHFKHGANGQVGKIHVPPVCSQICMQWLRKHAQRANYQAALWRYLEKHPEEPGPTERGWQWKNQDEPGSQLVVNWMDGKPAPQAVLDLQACSYTKSCKLPKCVCMASGLKCTYMCKINDFDNQQACADVTSDDGSSVFWVHQ